MAKQIPNFLIVGAMKAGTTSFGSDLNLHPDIYVASRELHFFNSEGNYKNGYEFYKKKFEGRIEKAIGEKTPSYSYHEKVPARIAEFNPNMKLIWLLRDPIQRSYSHYHFFIQKGMERFSFNKAIDRELAGENTKYFMNYLDRSIYSKQIKRYLMHFPINQMQFIVYKDYILNPHKCLKETCKFLGVDPDFSFPIQAAKRNVTRLPKSIQLQYFLTRLSNRVRLKSVNRMVHLIKKLNLKKSPGYPPLPLEEKKKLRKYFDPHVHELEEITKLDLKKWWR